MRIERPQQNEYPPFYQGYVARVPETDILQALREPPKELKRVADSVGARERYRYSPGKWSVREIFGHLVDAERFFGHRAFCISRSDPNPLPGFDENAYVAQSNYDSQSVSDLAHAFALLREANVQHLQSLSEDVWPREGVANGKTITVRALGYIMVGHARHHLAVLKERYGIG
jgi:hypothetical protein